MIGMMVGIIPVLAALVWFRCHFLAIPCRSIPLCHLLLMVFSFP